MAFELRVRRDAQSVKESGGAFIKESGVYPITINFVSLNKSDKGAVSFAINFNYQGSTQTLYGPTIQNTNGEENEIGYRVLNKLFVIADLPAGAQPTIETEIHSVGKDNKPTEFEVLTDLSGLEVQVQVVREFTKYKGEIKDRTHPINFFRADGATADEIIASEADENVEIGKQLAKILEKESTTKPKLGKDEHGQPVTQDEVDAYLEAIKSGNKQSASTASSNPAPIKKNLFA